MKIDGRELAEKIYQNLTKRVGELHKKNITPHLAVILIGHNPSSQSYVHQKQKMAEHIGAKVTIHRYEETISHQAIKTKLEQLNQDPSVHAILIQRPTPPHIDIHELETLTSPQKDIDGFHPDSPYTLPLPLAVVKILKEIHLKTLLTNHYPLQPFHQWLTTKTIVVIGKGETAGKPIINYFHKLHISFKQIDSRTVNPQDITKQTDIIIAATGKENLIRPENIKQGVILIGVSLFRGADGKLHGDYIEEAIKDKAQYYTPTPGGVGPVNVAMLMENLLTATEKAT